MRAKIQKALSFDAVRFALVGVANTLLDFAILNALFIGLDMNRIAANIISTSCAMTFSYFINRNVVFRHEGQGHRRQIVLFLLVTLSGLYIVQTIIILFFTQVWLWPADLVAELVPNMDPAVVITNVAKVFATFGSLVWNYVGYKYLVFKNDNPA